MDFESMKPMIEFKCCDKLWIAWSMSMAEAVEAVVEVVVDRENKHNHPDA